MITVLLADDNKYALSHFARLVDWEAAGFVLAGTAVDGVEAWEEFEQLHPQLVITDVQMPGMSGVELAARIRETAPDTVVIFLSSYDEFDYARAAIDLSVQDYILKPELTREVFEKKLADIRELIQKRKKRKQRVLRENLSLLFRAPLKELDEEFLQEILPGQYGFLVLEQDHIPEDVADWAGICTPETEVTALMPALCEECPGALYWARIAPYRLAVLLDAGSDCQEAGVWLRDKLREETQVGFSLYLYRDVLTARECRELYDAYLFLFEQRYFEGENAVLHADMYEKPKTYRAEASDRQSGKLISPENKRAVSLENKKTGNIKTGNMKQAQEPVISEFERMLGQAEETGLYIDNVFRPLMYYFDFEGVMRLGLALADTMQRFCAERRMQLSMVDDEILHLLSVRRMVRWLKNRASQIQGMCQAGHSEAVDRALNWIAQRYTDPLLSVEEIAKESGLSVNRLNDAFKKEMGETVGRCLTRIRMEKAAWLLENTQDPVLTTAEKMGYSSASYFSNVFRKAYGMSPQEYQSRKRKNK